MLSGKRMIALCLSRVNDDICHEYIMNLNRFVTERGWGLMVYATCTDLYWDTPEDKGEAAVFSLIRYDIVDAVIVLEETIKNKAVLDSIYSNCSENNIPVIRAGGTGGKINCLEFDYKAGFALVIRHVIEYHKVTDLHMIAGIRDNEFSEDRIKVFKDILEEKGIPFSEDMVSYGDFWSEPTEKAVKKLIAENRLPKAFICANDSMAISVCGVLSEHNIRVPEDILVTGFDGIMAIKFSVPKITSCICSYEDMAFESVRLLDCLFAGGESLEPVMITPRPIISESCGCCCSEPINTSLYLNDVNDRFFRYQEESRALNTIISKVQMCNTVEKAAKQFDVPYLFYNMCCVLKPECIDETADPTEAWESGFSEEKLFMFFNTDYSDPYVPYYFDSAEIIPGIEAVLEKKVPLIFYALHLLENPLGFVCFHFNDYSIANYCKMPQIVNTLNTCIGSYRNMRYQHFLNTRIEEMYKSDALTGLYNRSGFIKEYDKLLEDKEKVKNGLTVILADLDGLKFINDNYGHGEGDVAIRAVAFALIACCPSEAICARFGGDEMIAVMGGELTSDVKGDIEKYLECYTASSGKSYTVSASVGIYKAGYDEIGDFKELLKKSDKLMYMDKAKKKIKR